MIFNSSLFLLYFLPLFLIIYYLIDRKFKNGFLLLVSIFFYAWGAPKFVFVVMGSVIIDYLLIREFDRREGLLRRTLFWASVLMNIGLLVYFKYMNFFVDQFDTLLAMFGGKPGAWTKIALPVGISFITFQKLSYTFDVYKRNHPALQNIQDYALYVFMFPQLLSGPITRVGQVSAQIHDRRENENTDWRLSGFYRFMIGLAKKVLVADVLAVTVNEIFALNSLHLSSGMAWIGAIAFTFQIFFDFSGYTDMAIGLGRMIGFKLPENFNNPYISTSITDFWKRWHITLSLWLRDYLFLPLAYSASRKLKKERYIGLRTDKWLYIYAASITFLICGFWHGAAWTFLLWGAYQGLFLILDRLFLLKWLKKAGRYPSIAITFFVTVLGWVLFRSGSLDYAHFYYRRMFSFVSAESEIWLNPKFWTMLVIAIIFSFIGLIKKMENLKEGVYYKPKNAVLIAFTVIGILLFILGESSITSSGFSPFIYFRF